MFQLHSHLGYLDVLLWRGTLITFSWLLFINAKENILVVDGDEFIESPVDVLRSVENFLQIPSFYTERHFTKNGGSQCYRWALVWIKGQTQLTRASYQYNTRTEGLPLLQTGPGGSRQLHGGREREGTPGDQTRDQDLSQKDLQTNAGGIQYEDGHEYPTILNMFNQSKCFDSEWIKEPDKPLTSFYRQDSGLFLEIVRTDEHEVQLSEQDL